MRSHQLDLIPRDVATNRFTLLTALKVIIRAIGALANDTEFSRLHLLDLGDLLENLRGEELFHGYNIYVCIYYTTKERLFPQSSFICLTPSQESAAAKVLPLMLRAVSWSPTRDTMNY